MSLTLDGTTGISATGNITGNYFVGNGSLLTGIDATAIQNGTSNVRVVSSGGNVTISVGGTANVLVASSTGVVLPGTVTVNSGAAATAIINGAGNAVGNIGSSGTYFNRLFAQATTALYADLAEMYSSDVTYPPGTVLVFGGNQEVTISSHSHDNRVAGVVSTHPAHVMNSGQPGDHVLAVALAGRVPVNVIGPIQPGDCVVTSSTPGVAEVMDITRYQPGVVIGKALQEYSGTGVGTIEVVVGRL